MMKASANHSKALASAIVGGSRSAMMRSTMSRQCISVTPIAASQLRCLYMGCSKKKDRASSSHLIPVRCNVNALSGVTPSTSTHLVSRPTLLPQLRFATSTTSPCSGAKVPPTFKTPAGDENSTSGLSAEHVKMLEQVREAQDVFAAMTQEDADRIFTHIARVANKNRVPLARMAAEETGMGVFEDKVLKNGLAWQVLTLLLCITTHRMNCLRYSKLHRCIRRPVLICMYISSLVLQSSTVSSSLIVTRTPKPVA